MSARRELRRIVRIAAPVAGTQLAMIGLWVVDTVMLFEVSVEAQDAAALGRTWIVGTSMAAFGLLLGLDPVMSQAWGARDRRRLGDALQQGLALSLALSVPCGLLWLLTGPLLAWTGQNPALAHEAHRYALVQIPALPLVLVYGVMRQWLHCRGIATPALLVAVLANGVNALANWVLIFGNLGAPRLGVVGAGIATALVEVFMVAALAAWIRLRGLHRGAWSGWHRRAWDLRRTLPVLALGLPIAVQLGLEMWAFQIATLWAGRLGEGVVELAAHNICLQLASISFMIPLGIGIGAAARVGNLIGAGDPEGAQRCAWLSLGLSAAVMGAAGIVFVLGREALPGWYTDDARVVALAASILPIAAAFQVCDGLQVVSGGILRGMGRPRPAAVFNFVAYYVLALPLGWWWCFERDAGLHGIWWGLALALATVSALLLAFVRTRGPRTVRERVRA